MTAAPTLLIVAHGTRDPGGAATALRIVDRVRAARPHVRVELAFLDVLEPRLATALAALAGPVVVVPMLLSVGYHVLRDIPGIVADRLDTDLSKIVVTRHLGPDPLVAEAVVERLGEAAAGPIRAGSVALVAAGSSQPAARLDLGIAGALVSERTGVPVHCMTLIDDDLDERLGSLAGTAALAVAPYVIAQGSFADGIREHAESVGATSVAAPIGAHAALVRLVLARYDEGAAVTR